MSIILDSLLNVDKLWLSLLKVLSVCTSQLRLLSVITPRKSVLFTLTIWYSLLGFLIHFPACIDLSRRECSVFWFDLYINYLFQNITVLRLYFLRLFLGVHLYLVLY
jgi:hypothetical protein